MVFSKEDRVAFPEFCDLLAKHSGFGMLRLLVELEPVREVVPRVAVRTCSDHWVV